MPPRLAPEEVRPGASYKDRKFPPYGVETGIPPFSGNFDQTCGRCGIDKLDNGPVQDVSLRCNCLPALSAVPKYADLAISPNNNDPLAIKLVDVRFVCGSHQGDKVERNEATRPRSRPLP
ncbi:hypothetical protein V2A60_004728 [Cordyceps javanica]